MLKYLRFKRRFSTLLFVWLLILQIIFPATAYGLTEGPKSPEFSKFEPVATTDMVNPFSGDFTYNLPVLSVPGPDGGGYSLSLSYQSGTSSEQESSWVGHGWNLSPGSLTRGMRGIPDDYKDAEIVRYNKTEPNWSVSVQPSLGISAGNLEIFGYDINKSGLSANTNLRLNNHQGVARSYDFGLSFKGMVGLGMNVSAQGNTYSVEINPMAILSEFLENEEEANNDSGKKNDTKASDGYTGTIAQRSIKGSLDKILAKGMESIESAQKISTSSFGVYSFSEVVRNTTFSRYSGGGFNVASSLQVNPTLFPIGGEFGFNGHFNYQVNEENVTFLGNGYLHNLNTRNNLTPGNNDYSIDERMDKNTISDFYIEKDSPYKKRDYILGIPFSSPDNFLIAGEGLSGGFRYYQQQAGHFYPDFASSKTTTGDLGVELMVGTNLGIGLDLGYGEQKTNSTRWTNEGNTSSYQFNNEGFFRFNNDLGGEVSYSLNTKAESANLNGIPGLSPPMMVSQDINDQDEPVSKARSSIIESHTLSDLSQGLRFDHQSKTLNTLVDKIRNNQGAISNENTICEFQVTKENGNIYTFGLPVFNANEVNIQVDAEVSSREQCPVGAYTDCTINNHLVHQPLHYGAFPKLELSEHKQVVGESKKEPYAGLFLLTQITTNDFVDRNNDGPDESDFGGWTKFHYENHYSLENPYRWRTPYSGLYYAQNSISNTADDMASVFTGDKEVYTLEAIETKSHIALFVTNQSIAADFEDILPEEFLNHNLHYLDGSGKSRKDGLGAKRVLSGSDPHAVDPTTKGDQKLVYLEKIVLYAKSRPNRPMVSTRFSYDYSLVKQLPNNQNGTYPRNAGSNYLKSGKLTLRKVWFEYEGTHPTRISPYQFSYTTRTNFPSELTNKYPWLGTVNQGLTPRQKNPDYSPFLLNAWGHYQANGPYRKMQKNPWPSQRIADYRNGFDPAAWQLKRIQLPSGGEILVDYEEKDYRFVQDRPAMAMASLRSANLADNAFEINLEDLGVDPTDRQQVDAIAAACEDWYFNGPEERKKMFFKFLFSFSGSSPSFDNCDSEYISGYANISAVRVSGNGPWGIRIELDDNEDLTPAKACYDYYTTQRVGFKSKQVTTDDGDVNTYLCTIPLPDGIGSAKASDQLPLTLTESLRPSAESGHTGTALALIQKVAGMAITPSFGIPGRGSVCRTIDPVRSYLKIPMVTPKRGAGIRVKRLLMYDPGIEGESPALFGNEYRYVDQKGRSSGVATNEPSSMREENALVSFMPRAEQGWYNRLTAGADLKQTEGPFGESILPMPSVGHSRVEVHNIHQGVTGAGYEAFEYYTVKDYPFDKWYNAQVNNDISQGRGAAFTKLSDNQIEDNFKIPAGLFKISLSDMFAAQGFRFIVNNMHGQPKSEQTFGRSGDNDFFLSSKKTYDYYSPGEKVRMLRPGGGFSYQNPGKEMDLTMVARSLRNKSLGFSVEIDVSLGLAIPPPPTITGVPSIRVNESELSTHLTSKVIRYPAMMKSVKNFVDGTFQQTDFLAFDHYNGQPVLTRTTDEYDEAIIDGVAWDGSVYSFKIPASHVYPSMGPKHLASTNTNQLESITANFNTYGVGGNPLETIQNGEYTLDKVLSASVQTYGNIEEWFSSSAIKQGYGLNNDLVEKLGNIWRPYQNFVLKADRTNYDLEGGHSIKDAGIIPDFTMYRFEPGSAQVNKDNGWLELNKITKYSPHGAVLEEKDILGRHFSIKYSENYRRILPAIRASNAQYENIAFEDFESPQLQGVVKTSTAHSGKYAYRINANADDIQLESLPISPLFYTEKLNDSRGAWVKLWVNGVTGENDLFVRINNSAQTRTRLERIASTGEWTLYRALLSPEKFDQGRVRIGSKIDLNLETEQDILIDDLRFQPYDAQATCYVYDTESLRLIAQFDDQHFGLYYRYNQEGQLTYKQIETERGMQTLQETQYHTPKVSKQ